MSPAGVATPEAGGRGAAAYVGVIPALNASSTIGPVVAGTLRHLPRVLVVDDGSTDDTSARARAAGAEVLRHPGNLGKGAALCTAFAHILAGGGQHDPEDIPVFLELHRSARPALIVGSRAGDFAAMWGPRRALNRFSS